MAVKNILNKLTFNRWIPVDLGKFNDFYLIAIKDKMHNSDTFNASDVNKINFEVGIDSGINNKPLTIQYISLNFEETTSSDNLLNTITAFKRFMNFPNEFYLKVKSVELKNNLTINEGSTSIAININVVNLG